MVKNHHVAHQDNEKDHHVAHQNNDKNHHDAHQNNDKNHHDYYLKGRWDDRLLGVLCTKTPSYKS